GPAFVATDTGGQRERRRPRGRQRLFQSRCARGVRADDGPPARQPGDGATRAADQLARPIAAGEHPARPPHGRARPRPDARGLAPTRGTLVSGNRAGSGGAVVEITAEAFDVGRTEGSLNFADDPYLAPRHVRLLVQSGKVILRPLDSVNGVFVRVQSFDLA